MTSRERVRAAIERRPLDRVPRYDSFWEDTLALYQTCGLVLPTPRTLLVDGMERNIDDPVGDTFGFDLDTLFTDVSMRFPARVLSRSDAFIVVEDRCGYTAKKFDDRASSMTFIDHKIKTQEDWMRHRHQFRFDPTERARVDRTTFFMRTEPYPTWEGFRGLFDAVRNRNKYLAIVGYGPFEAIWRCHGWEETLTDMLLEPEWMSEMFMAAADLLIDTVAFMDDHGMKPDAVWINEDMGGTHTLLFAPYVYDELLFSLHHRIAEALHRRGIHLIMHSCGKIAPLLPRLIEVGVDVIQALQANTGMDVVELRAEYGKDITFFGNIAEHAFAKGPEAIEAELRRKIPVAMAGGGYIYHSDHSIPPEVDLSTYLHAMRVLDEVGAY